MPLIVETGSIVQNSSSYVSIVDCDTYHVDNGNAAWAGTDAIKEAALRKAARYLDGHYRSRWLGSRVLPTSQSMEWPRYGIKLGFSSSVIGGVYYNGQPINNFVPSTTVPQRVKDAQCELALRALTAELSADGTGNIKREKVDVLETEYFANSVPKQVYQVVDQLLSDYLQPLGNCTVTRG